MNNVIEENEAVAIIGMACRFPGAETPEQFWANLRDGVESISIFSDSEVIASGVDPELVNHRNYVKAGGSLKDIAKFDAGYFGITPRDAELMDPQQRIFLECVTEALESAGYLTDEYDGLIGIFAGSNISTYWENHLKTRDGLIDGDLSAAMANNKDFLTTFVSYKLDLKGPSYSLSTGCSTSLVSVVVACQSLLSYQCDIAVAGGVSIITPQRTGYLYQGVGIASPDGHCRTFDAQAQGTVGGNGSGVVILKRLSEAIENRDPIHAVIKGSAMNNDGSLKVGFAAPSVQGQAEVIAMAQAVAGVQAETITYVEAHGTGTQIGDPIEVSALTRAFRAGTDKQGFCALGSVKTNLGHLDTAAGIAGLIKTVLALKHRQLPPSLHYKTPNPKINFSNSPFFVNTELREWKTDGGPLRAGVSSFGIGGTNAHVILEEAPQAAKSTDFKPWHLLPLSAKTPTALAAYAQVLADHLKENADLSIADVAYTLSVGRRSLPHRLSLVCRDREEAVEILSTFNPQRIHIGAPGQGTQSSVWMFPGLGEHYKEMGAGLYRDEAVFRKYVDRCAELLQPHLPLDIRDVLFANRANNGRPTSPGESNGMARVFDLRKMLGREAIAEETLNEPIHQIRYTHAALFTIEYSLAKLLMSWGLNPRAMIGYSISEYVVACLASVLSLEDALMLIARRGALMEETPRGAMLAVPAPRHEIESFLDSSVSIAAENGPALCILAGSDDGIARIEKHFTTPDRVCRRLQASYAFHSRMMEPIMDRFLDLVRSIKLSPPKIPYISNVTGDWIKSEEATDPVYWAKHLSQTVRFGEGVARLWELERAVMLEVGPGNSLSSLALQQAPLQKVQAFSIPTMRAAYDAQSDLAALLSAWGKLWLAGVRIDWNAYYKTEARQRLALPTYPFERQDYWVELSTLSEKAPSPSKQLGHRQTKKQDIADWFYVPSWKRTPWQQTNKQKVAGLVSRWLLLTDKGGIAHGLAESLRENGAECITVTYGSAFEVIGDRACVVNPESAEDFSSMITWLRASEQLPERIVHCWLLDAESHGEGGTAFAEAQTRGFYSILHLVRALGAAGVQDSIRLEILTQGVHEITGDEQLYPERATVLGPCNVVPQEYPNIRCRNIDLALIEQGETSRKRIIAGLLREFTEEGVGNIVVHRGPYRWVQRFERVRLEECFPQASKIRQGGVYLITGGLGKIGLILTEHLCSQYNAKVVLVGRSPFPAKETGKSESWTGDKRGRASTVAEKLLQLEAAGAQWAYYQADIADKARMNEVLENAQARFGALNGVIHAAGITTAGSIQDLTMQECEEHFRPKAQGLIILSELLQSVNLDFCVLLSSTASILGGLGFMAYSAANNFMDAFARRCNRVSPFPWISSNWDSWAEEEEFVRHTAPDDPFHQLFMHPRESTQAWERILAGETAPQVIVAINDLKIRMAQWIKLESGGSTESAETVTLAHPRPSLQTMYIAPSNEIERTLVEIWQEVLGIGQIGVHDNFFELGGHSLLGTRIIARVRKAFSIDLPVRIIFNTPTIAGFSDVIIQKQAEQMGEQALTELMEQLDLLSEENAQQLLLTSSTFESSSEQHV